MDINKYMHETTDNKESDKNNQMGIEETNCWRRESM